MDNSRKETIEILTKQLFKENFHFMFMSPSQTMAIDIRLGVENKIIQIPTDINEIDLIEKLSDYIDFNESEKKRKAEEKEKLKDTPYAYIKELVNDMKKKRKREKN